MVSSTQEQKRYFEAYCCIWYGLPDVQLAQCLYQDLLFRKFYRLELGGAVPEASTLGRFRLMPPRLRRRSRALEAG